MKHRRVDADESVKLSRTILRKVLEEKHAILSADAGSDVRIWARRPEVAKEINTDRTNREYLADVVLPPGVRATTDAAEALDGVTTVLLAVPSQKLRANIEQWTSLIDPGATLVSLAKGIEHVAFDRSGFRYHGRIKALADAAREAGLKF